MNARAEESRSRAPFPHPWPLQTFLGLLVSLIGFLLLSLLLPVGPSPLARAIPLAGGAAVALWVGGILMGNSMRPLRMRRRR